MKKGILIAGLAVAVVFAQTRSAQAINKEWSAVAGFVGGLLVANAANCTPRYQTRTVYQPVETRVVYEQPPKRVLYRPARERVVFEEPVRTGHYEWRTRRVWHPGRWVYEETGCGTQRKVWYPGYYTTQNYKVWVDTTCRSGW